MKRRGFVVFCVGIFLAVFWGFSLKEWEVSALNFVDEEALQGEISRFEGESIVGLFLFRSLHQVLENNAKIESFSIGYRFPFSLVIRVTEKKPWLSCLVKGDSVLLDESGVVLSYGGDNSMIEGDSLFVVKGLDKGDFLADRIEPLVWRRLRELQGYFSDFLPGTGLMLEQGADGAFQLVIDDHMVVYLGDLEQLDSKFQRLRYFLQSQDPAGYTEIDYIDCRVDHKLLVSYETK